MSPGAGVYPPLISHGPDDRGATVVVVTYALMFITILFAIMRTWTSHSQKREMQWDDLAFYLAVVGPLGPAHTTTAPNLSLLLASTHC
jgi:hypothetical protein